MSVILIGLGSNVPGPWGSPRQTVKKALKVLAKAPCALVKASSLIISKPLGIIDQPDFINAVVQIETKLSPEDLMAHLHDIELQANRRRTIRWGPRTLDLDLLDYNGLVKDGNGSSRGHQLPLFLPHPGITERSFVLEPIAEIAPDWQHPVLTKTAQVLLAEISGNKA